MGHAAAHDEKQDLLVRGIEAVDKGDTASGLFCLEGLAETRHDPRVRSYYAVCLAKERREVEKGVALCREAMEKDPGNSVHYLNLGRVLVAAGRKKEAIKAFRDGLLYGRNQLIVRELDKLGWRNTPVIPWLERGHPLNKSLGLILYRLGLR